MSVRSTRSPSSSAMICTVPCVHGCDGPMLTMTVSSRSPAVNAGRTGFGRTVLTAFSSDPVGHEGLLALLRVVLAQRMPDEALVEQHGPQVVVAAEADAEHLVTFALHEPRRA